jgi:hypothetical protein
MSEAAFTHFEPGPELTRRQSDLLTYELIAHKVTRIAERMDDLKTSVATIDKTLHTHMAATVEDRKKIISEIVLQSFPDGDSEAHRRTHEASIKKAEASAKLLADVQASTAKWGIAGFLSWVVYNLWVALIHGPTK